MAAQRTHELVAITESRGEFCIHSGTKETVGQASSDLRGFLEALDKTKGHILVRLPASELVEVIERPIVTSD